MLQPLVSLALALAVHAEPAKPAGPEIIPEPPPGANIGFASDYDDPPKGSPAELQLWRDGIEITRKVVVDRRASFNLRARIKSANLPGRLIEARKAAGHEHAEALELLERKLRKAFADDVDVYQRQWPVDPTRVCGYPHLLYDSALRLPPGPNRQAEVANATPDLKTCVATARAADAAMAGATRRLAAVAKEVEEALAAAKAGAGAGEAKERHEAHERQEKGEQKEHGKGERHEHEKGERREREGK